MNEENYEHEIEMIKIDYEHEIEMAKLDYEHKGWQEGFECSSKIHLIFLILVILPLFILFMVLSNSSTESSLREEAIKNGVAEYDSKTGEFKWKEQLVKETNKKD